MMQSCDNVKLIVFVEIKLKLIYKTVWLLNTHILAQVKFKSYIVINRICRKSVKAASCKTLKLLAQ